MLLQLKQITIPPGQRILVSGLDWKKFETILANLGEKRNTKIAYDRGVLEIMVPLPEHEENKEIIGDLIKALLEEVDLDFWQLGSTTFKNTEMLQGIEPDNCFYIQNEAKVRGKKRLNLAVDPPPDLALEIEVTARTHPELYASLQVPELWRFEGGKLQVNVLNHGRYVEVETSPTFPNLPLKTAIPDFLERCKREGRNQTMKAFREWVRSATGNNNL